MKNGGQKLKQTCILFMQKKFMRKVIVQTTEVYDTVHSIYYLKRYLKSNCYEKNKIIPWLKKILIKLYEN